MKLTVKGMIESLEYDDLLKIKYDLDKGGIHLKNLVKNRVKELQKQHGETCSVCQNNLDMDKTNNYTIIMGPDDLRMKASFCGVDCMEYFIKKMKDIKKVKP